MKKALVFFAALFFAAPLRAGQCLGDSLRFRSLGYEVGIPNAKSITPVR